MSVPLAAVAALLRVEAPADLAAVAVEDVCHDSRVVPPGSLFACIPGSTADGHDHAAAAVEAGAIALLAERTLDLGVPELVVPSVRRAVGPASSMVHGNPSGRLDLVGVTGTNGKTTTVRILVGLLASLGVAAREIGTLTGERTTPEAPELQRTLAAAVRAGERVVAMEVSSHALDQHRVDGCRFRVVAFTNLGIDHLDYHRTVEQYFAAKRLLFRPDLAETAVIDVRTQFGRRLADEIDIPVVRVREDGIDASQTSPGRSRFRWRDQTVDLPLGGAFNIVNAVMAAEIAVVLGHDHASVAAALVEAPAVPGRFESIDEGQQFTVIVDYAHTPDGLEALLGAAREVTDGSLVLVFGAGGDRDESKRPLMGAVARGHADHVVVTSDNPRGERPEAIISGIVSGMTDPPDLVEPDRRRAIRAAFTNARPGDVVLIAGKGHETTQTIGDEVVDFDDRAVARDELRRFGGMAS